MSRLGLVCLLVGLGPATLASAQPDRPGRRRPAEERRVSAPSDEPRARRAEPTDLEERLYLQERPDSVGEETDGAMNERIESLLREREQLLARRRAQAIELLVTFIRDEPEDAPEMPDALLRLAELRWEEARAEYLQTFAAWQQVPEANRGPEPTPQYDVALGLYDRILERHRDFPRYDLVLYMKAYALVERGDTDGALALYQRILDEFPDSRFAPDAHFAKAEASFTGSYDYAAALAEYERVLEHPSSPLYDIALFKSAWCMWRLGRNTEAARRFRQVLDLGRNRQRLSAAQRRRLQDLQNEALDYLIQVFTEDESNTARDVFTFLEEIGGERYANRVLGRLSETYMGQARYERAIGAFGLLLELDPTAPDAPEYRRQVARAYARMGDVPHTIEALTVLAEGYGPGSTWATQQGDAEVVARARRRAERAVRRQALEYHEEGQRERQAQLFEHAATLYRVYLEHFPDADPAYEIRFYLAEILFHRLEAWAEAGEAYMATVRANPEGRFNRDALYNAIGAFEQIREGEVQRCLQEGRRQARPGDEPVCEETENDRKFSEAIELYVDLYPNDPDLPEILFRQGRLYYDRGIFDPAVRLFGQLLERFPENRWAEPAGELILDSFNRASDYQNIEAWARRLKEAPAFQTPEKQRRLDGLILQSIFKIGEQLAERGEHAAAANAYYRAAEEFPDDARARQAYFNAGVERQRDGDLSGAADAYDRLVERYPGSEEGASGAWAAAQMYESIAQFRDAARYYETYATRFPSGEHATDAAYNAVLLRVTAGDNSAAVEAGRRFLASYPQHDSADDVTFFIGRAQEQAEDWDDAAETYRNYTRSSRNLDRKVEALTRLAQVLIRDGDSRGGNRALEEAVRVGRRSADRLTDGLYYAAQARYLQGDQVMSRYEAITISGDMAGLRRRLEQKTELLREAALIYADVVEFQVAEWVTAALFQIGRSYELYADAMRDAPVPEGLSEEQEISYQDQLNQFIIPMEERALEAYDGGYRRAIELRIFNRWTASLREGLTRLNDIEFPPLREIGGDIVTGAPLPSPRPLDGLRRDGLETRSAADPTPEGGAAEGAAEGDS